MLVATFFILFIAGVILFLVLLARFVGTRIDELKNRMDALETQQAIHRIQDNEALREEIRQSMLLIETWTKEK